MDTTALKIGELAKSFGVTTRAIRFYEEKGLLNPEWSPSQRLYSQGDCARLQVILRCKRLGLSLDEIREVLAIREIPPGVHEPLQHHVIKLTKWCNRLERQQQAIRELLEELDAAKTVAQQELARSVLPTRNEANGARHTGIPLPDCETSD
ncbi:MAG TPA: MerR family transcriptional regulator [Candidatus Competibacteraceae bacterium]|nr:MerR family transcriptional regulator [Candidatus Competibacteraceae bacterium]